MRLFALPTSFARRNNFVALTRGTLTKDMFRSPDTVATKEELAVYSGAIYERNSRKKEATPDAINYLIFDIDNTSVRRMREVREKIRTRYELEHILHTTHSHTAATPKYRLLIPLTRPLTSDEYPPVWREANTSLGLESDEVFAQPKQMAYVPAKNATNPDDYKWVMSPGDAIDPDVYLERVAAATPVSLEEDDFAEALAQLEQQPVEPPPGVPEDAFVAAVLSCYDPRELDYSQWCEVILAVAHQLDHAEEGIDLLCDWSRADGHNALHYESTDQDIAKKYRSEGSRGRPLTLRKILNKKARTRNRDGKIATVRASTVLGETYRLLMQQCDTSESLDTLAEHVQADPYADSAANLGRMATEYRNTYVKVVPDGADDAPSAAEARRLLSSGASAYKEPVADDEALYFYDRYVWQRWDDRIYCLATGKTSSVRGFNADHRTRMPAKRSGDYPIPTDVITQGQHGYKPMRMADGFDYLIEGPYLIEKEGLWYINQYVRNSWPKVADDDPFNADDPLDAKIAGMVECHLRLMGNNDKAASNGIRDWIAHMRQHPHERNEWGIAVLSIYQGIGKSRLEALCGAVLGEAQVTSITPHQVNEKMNDWQAAPKLVSFLDEPDKFTRVKGAAVDIDMLKSFITSPFSQIRRHYSAWETATTHTALAITSNNVHIMGEDFGGRRWLASVIERGSPSQAKMILKAPLQVFFDEYSELLEEYPARFAAYFESIDLSNYSKRRVPATKQSDERKTTNSAAITHVVMCDAIRSRREPDIHETIILLPALRETIERLSLDDDIDLQRLASRTATQLQGLMEGALAMEGYAPMSRKKGDRLRIKFDKNSRPYSSNVWVKDGVRRGSKETPSEFGRRLLKEARAKHAAATDNVVNLFDDAA